MESAPAKEKDSAAESRQSLVSAWHRENCMLDVSEKEMLLNFYFSAMAQSVSCPAKGRMKKLITDLNTMRLSLPEGIFVRHGTSRMDIMKVLIVGPAGTHTKAVSIEFDLFLPGYVPPDSAHDEAQDNRIAGVLDSIQTCILTAQVCLPLSH